MAERGSQRASKRASKRASERSSRNPPLVSNRHPIVDKYFNEEADWIPELFQNPSRRFPGPNTTSPTNFLVGKTKGQEDVYFNVIKGHAEGKFGLSFHKKLGSTKGHENKVKRADVELDDDLKFENWLPLAGSHQGAESSRHASKMAWTQFMIQAAFAVVPGDKAKVMLDPKEKKTAANKERDRRKSAISHDERIRQEESDSDEDGDGGDDGDDDSDNDSDPEEAVIDEKGALWDANDTGQSYSGGTVTANPTPSSKLHVQQWDSDTIHVLKGLDHLSELVKQGKAPPAITKFWKDVTQGS